MRLKQGTALYKFLGWNNRRATCPHLEGSKRFAFGCARFAGCLLHWQDTTPPDENWTIRATTEKYLTRPSGQKAHLEDAAHEFARRFRVSLEWVNCALFLLPAPTTLRYPSARTSTGCPGIVNPVPLPVLGTFHSVRC